MPNAHCWGEQYGYDAWGNLLSNSPIQPQYNGCTQESGFNFTGSMGANNRITASGYSYDSAGNMIADPPAGTAYTYDAENHLLTAGGVTYTYDGNGKRVIKSNGTIYWYGMNSDALMETDLSNNFRNSYVFFNGKRIARSDASNQVSWFFADALGSSRMVWTLAGYNQSDFYPFGGERVLTTGTPTNYKFTGKERDPESGLDNFDKRYYGSNAGRMMRADPVFFQAEMLTDPQRFNEYAYARNNPLLYIDPSGEAIQLSGNAAEQQDQLNAICSAAGISSDKCSYYIYANKAGDGNYYVGIYTNGADATGTSFQNLNDIAGAFGSVINDQRVVQLDVVSAGTTLTDNQGGHRTIGPVDIKNNISPGATYIGQDGKWHIALLDPATAPGALPGNMMRNGQPGQLDQGIMIAHELGHVRGEWNLVSWLDSIFDPHGKDESINLENKVRKLRDPNAQLRRDHDPNPYLQQ